MAVLEEAAKIGVYWLDFWATQSFEETGIGIPITMEELFWGDAGSGSRSSVRRLRPPRSGATGPTSRRGVDPPDVW